MRIQLYDRGLLPGKQLFTDLQALCQRLQVDYDPEYIKDMTRVYAMGLQGNTILLIDGEVVLIDKYPSIKELENILNDYRK
ncbi:MAG: hypothetical protein US68_C0010G0053 [Candidatus Shapirobacteria bacterium GW2011_GWE1_38_10]|uniref:Uncharacterized protein n=1 Tax=Candidatus Shapirobacteria bacterium GW2011_GWE1_38_10 TaxID=1618488 RepID=A0A0G0KL59_9BACT|nr:MAG: hypothetical protein US46_C0013G0008 [Candidatus Shapirobacteria bacterium GW2011_GWF2_37_20]KKQ49919.1 MAG: hypothetical protein US68_C0010G0053 [Candidatus Shapirobacteria bacterium GW2011_GWE1_38_10]KKQ64347.1 MAG: hypothetical protein US85_C0011G0004 [Candidatus Shapirobacteria bacterium GW2011_GWF1_38_23]HBP51537.1 hypothetical protein [Candidatus Shapirobacteria bacterium]